MVGQLQLQQERDVLITQNPRNCNARAAVAMTTRYRAQDVWDPLLRDWDEPLNATRQEALAEQAAEAFQHSYRGYIAHGYPADNVRPQSCQPEDVQVRGSTLGPG